jgi:nitroreductase
MTTIDDPLGRAVPADHVLSSLLDNRFSRRGFQDQPVDTGTITRILELAQRSPSWCNTQSWQVIVTTAEATDRLRAATGAFAAVAPLIREQFDLPDDRQVLCGVSLGHPNDAHPANGSRTTRATIDEIATWAK